MADAVGLAYAVLSAIFAGAGAAAIGYLKKEHQTFDKRKFLYTVVYAVLLVLAGVFLGLPVPTPPEVTEAALTDIGAFALFIYATQAIVQLLWRRVIEPLYAKYKGMSTSPG